jgi:hypothetical protein
MRIGMPVGDKGILANPVTLKECKTAIKRKELRGIYVMERGTTEVGFELDLEPTTSGIFT